VSVRGRQALEYLESQCSQALGDLAVGEGVASWLLHPDGKVAALVRVSRIAEDGFVVDVDGGFGEAVMARLARFKLRSRLELALLPWSCVALRGQGVASLRPEPTRVPPTGVAGPLALAIEWDGWTGVDLLGPPPLRVPEGIRWCGPDAWEACRVEAGVPHMGAELDERTIPAETGLVERTVSFTKGCYTGQELVARIDARGSRVARRLCAVVPASPTELQASVLLGARIWSADRSKEVGRITSSAWCPGAGGPAGLAFVHRSVEIGGRVTVAVEPVEASPVIAEVRSLPLV
jgi:folate-binding protein YgfZ